METTALVVTGLILALGIYDLIVVARGGVGTSVSRFLQRSAFKSPLVAFTFGFVGFHLFGYMKPECPPCDDKVALEEYHKDGKGPVQKWIENLLKQKTE
mgnify:CR=1 FL=1